MSAGNLIIEGNVVKGYNGESAHIIIPEGITEIGDNAFADCVWIKKVTIESATFRTIGKNAFSGCSSLERITIKSLYGGIGKAAFYNCSKLEIIDIPSGAMEIGSNAFGRCSGLQLVRIPDSVMVIAADAFDAIASKMLLLLCKAKSDAEKYAEKHYIPCRSDFQFHQINQALAYANSRRKLIGTRNFELFGQSVAAPNSMALKESVIEHYKCKKKPFFDLVISRIPQKYSDLFEASKICEDFLQFATYTVERLEKHGVYTTQLRVLKNAKQIFDTLTSKIESVGGIIDGLSNIRNSHLSERKKELQYEAESKVTGLSYGIIGDSLTLALHAVDDFNARQKQRKEAYAVAQKQYDQETTRASNIINENYRKILKDNIQPTFRTLTDAYMDALCAAEISHLEDYGLLEDIDLTAYDAKKSTDILQRSARSNAEYAVGLALKTYPLNTKALELAGKENYATEEILEYISFMQVEDITVIGSVLKSEKITLSALVRFHNQTAYAGVCKQEIKARIEPIKKEIDTLACGKNGSSTAADYQNQISGLIGCDLWIAVNQITPILSDSALKKLGLTQQEASTENGYVSVGQRIYDYNDKFTRADEQAEAVVNSQVSIQEKISAVYELREILGVQKAKEWLFNDLTRIGEQILQDQLPAYTGKNIGETKLAIKHKIEDALGCEAPLKLSAMHMDDFAIEVWSDVLNAQYIKTEQEKYAQQLGSKLQSILDYREAFDIAKQYAWNVNRADLREIMKEHTKIAAKQLDQLGDIVDISKSAKETDAKELSIKGLHLLMSEECWIVYYLCAFTMSTDPAHAKNQLESTVYAEAAQTVRNEIIYREACTALAVAKNVNAVQNAKKRFEDINGYYKDCFAQIAECDKKILKYIKTRKVLTNSIVIFSTVFVVAFITALFTFIIPNSKYNEATAILEAGKVVEAYEVLAALDGYKPAEIKAAAIYDEYREYKVGKWKNAKVGDSISFGTYEQDNNTANGKETIEWIILDVENGKALIISKYALDCKLYHTDYSDVTWEKCSLRKWLNNDFINSAFSVGERTMIPMVTLSTEDIDKNIETTQDQVFLLSFKEAKQYFRSVDTRECTATKYAIANGASYLKCEWRLRNAGWYNSACVQDDGGIGYGDKFSDGHRTVRPALWIDLGIIP